MRRGTIRIAAGALCLMGLGSTLISGRDQEVRQDRHLETYSIIQPKPLPLERQQHYQALRKFALGRTLEHQRQWAEAMKAYEEALKEDPKAVAVMKAMIPLSYRLDREAFAMECCRKALELDPDDYELAFRYGQELREKGKKGDALAVLQKAVNVPAAKGRPAVYAQMLYSLAQLQEELNQPAAAASTYAQVAALLEQPELILADPASVDRKQIIEEAARTYERLGQVRLRAGQYKEALAAFQTARDKAPERAAAMLLRMAEVYQASQQLDQALHYLRLYLRSQPMGVDAYDKLVELLSQMNREEEILPELEQAIARDSFNQPLKQLYARQLIARGKLAQAEPLLTHMMQESPTEAVYRILADLFVQQSRWQELLQRFDNDAAAVERASLARLQLEVISKDRVMVHGLALAAVKQLSQGKSLAARTRQLLAVLSRQAKLHELSEPLYRSLLQDEPQSAEVYLELIRLFSETEQYEKVLGICRDALALKTEVPAHVFQLEMARAYSMLGDFQTAVDLNRQVISQTAARSREQDQANVTLLLLHYRAGQFKEAVQWGEDLLKEREEPALQRPIRHLLSGAYAAMKEYDEAQKHLEHLFAIDPEDHILCNDLGYLWAEQGNNLEQAEKLIRKAIELDRAERQRHRSPLDKPGPLPDHGAYLDSLGWVLFKQGKVQEALALLQQAAAAPDGDDPAIHAHLAEVLEVRGDVHRAYQHWQKAQALYLTPKYRGFQTRRTEVEAHLRRLEILRASGNR